MALEVYHHPDGGDYVILNDHGLSMKMDDGRWEPAILYTRVVRGPTGKWQFEGRNQFVTSKERWSDRFTATGETTAHRSI
jgi:hypothetical protein